jgi:NADH:ubiquinone oxidoreductase subunit 2 (subunit N)
LSPFVNWKSWFLLIIGLTTVIAVRVDRVFVIWVRIELGLVVVTPLISTRYLNNNEAVVKYFLIQSLRGLIILYSWTRCGLRAYFTLVGVVLKLGLTPLHYWVPEVFKSSSYPLVFILSTAIKIPGLVLLSIRARGLVWRLMAIRVLVGRAAGVYNSNLKVLLGYSSVVHTGWLCPLTKFPSRWVAYFRLYRTMVASLLHQFNSLNLKTLGQLSYTPVRQSLPIVLRVLSLSGLPPTLGFRLKWGSFFRDCQKIPCLRVPGSRMWNFNPHPESHYTLESFNSQAALWSSILKHGNTPLKSRTQMQMLLLTRIVLLILPLLTSGQPSTTQESIQSFIIASVLQE